MNRSFRYLLAVCAVALSIACSGGPDGGDDGFRIAVIPKGTMHEFWRSVHAGAVKAERELRDQGVPVTIIWKGPLREDDREQQIQVVESFLSQDIDGIVLAPLDDKALIRPVQEAKRAGIPTVIFDSGLASDEIVSFVATDNRKGGHIAAEYLGKLMNGTGKALMLRYMEGSASTRNREEGFLEKFRALYPDIEIVSSEQYAGPTRDSAKRSSENLLNRFGEDLQGIFCPCEPVAIGMLLALQDIGKARSVNLIGFDSTELMVQGIKDRELDGLVVQDPVKMGYLGVKTMVAHLQGQQVPRRIDTGSVMVTPDVFDDPEIQRLINPPIEQYLGPESKNSPRP